MNDCTQANEITEAVAPIFIYLVVVNLTVLISCSYVAVKMFTHPAVAPIFIYLVVVNLTVLISCSYVAVKMFTHPHVHIHLRLILLNVILGMMFRTAFTTLRAILRLRLLVGAYTDPCGFLEEYSFCSAISSITLPAVKVIPINYILITVERGVALFFAHNYERIRCIPLVILIAGATWYNLPETVTKAWRGFWVGDSGRYLPYCASTTVGTASFWTLIEWTTPANIINAVALIVLHILTRKRTKLSLSSSPMLSSRYELRWSLRSLRWLLPAVLVFCAISLAMQITSIIIVNITIAPQRNYAIFKESYSAAVFPTMYLSLPLMCLWRCPEFRPKWGRRPRRIGAVQLETQIVDPNEAMRHVLNVWDMHAPPRKPK